MPRGILVADRSFALLQDRGGDAGEDERNDPRGRPEGMPRLHLGRPADDLELRAPAALSIPLHERRRRREEPVQAAAMGHGRVPSDEG